MLLCIPFLYEFYLPYYIKKYIYFQIDTKDLQAVIQHDKKGGLKILVMH